MKQWWTRKEMIEAQLPGLTSHATITRVAKQLGWSDQSAKCRKRSGRGGGIEVHVSLLPKDAQIAAAALDSTSAQVNIETKREAVAYEAGRDLTADQKDERDARLAILAMVDKLAADADLSFRSAAIRFAELYNSRAIAIESWIVQQKPKISRSTLFDWRKQRDSGDFDALASTRKNNRAATGILDVANGGAVRTYVLALIAKQPHLTAKPILAAILKKFGKELEVIDRETGEITYKPMPTLRTVQHAIAVWKNEHRNTLLRLTNPDKYKGAVRMVMAGGASAHVQRLNQLWEIDASPADVMTKDGRKNIYACVDVWSRRALVLVTDTPRSSAVGLLVRDAIIKWGLPEAIKTDNGSDFISKQTKRFFGALGVEHLVCDPFSPEQKPHVERFIKTYQHGFARLLPGFIGHSVADRSVIENRKRFSARIGTAESDIFNVDLTPEELQAYTTEWVEKVYHNEPHSSLGATTPNERAASSHIGAKTVDENALDILLAPIPDGNGLRKITKSGIRLNNEHYLIGNVPVGETVFCRMDPRDMGILYVYDEDGETYFGQAISPTLSGVDPQQLITETRRMQKAIEDKEIAPIRRQMRKIKPRDVLDAVLEKERAEKVVQFPQKRAEISTSKIDAAKETLHELRPQLLTPQQQALREEIQRELGANKPQNEAPQNTNQDKPQSIVSRQTPAQRFKRACELEHRLSQFEPITESDSQWLEGYRQSPEYKAQKQMMEDFSDKSKG